jgi:hypothetical protein
LLSFASSQSPKAGAFYEKKASKKAPVEKIVGLTWLQKLSIEAAIAFAADRAELDEGFEIEDSRSRFRAETLTAKLHKLLALFRKKTKHMKPPRRRRKRRVKK